MCTSLIPLWPRSTLIWRDMSAGPSADSLSFLIFAARDAASWKERERDPGQQVCCESQETSQEHGAPRSSCTNIRNLLSRRSWHEDVHACWNARIAHLGRPGTFSARVIFFFAPAPELHIGPRDMLALPGRSTGSPEPTPNASTCFQRFSPLRFGRMCGTMRGIPVAWQRQRKAGRERERERGRRPPALGLGQCCANPRQAE
jgi:hypothetical protein